MGLAIVFSGQGNQYPEMFNKFAGQFKPENINQISDYLKVKISPLIELDAQKLFGGEYAQPLIAAHGWLIWDYLKQYLPEPVAMAGYSLGEVTAVLASGNFSLSQLLEITAARAKFMATSVPSGLIAVSGIADLLLQKICQANNCYPAILNAPDQSIIGGASIDLDRCEIQLQHLSGQIKLQHLKVEVAAHTPLLSKASHEFAEYLKNYSESNLKHRIISGVNAHVQYQLPDALTSLVSQISQTINFNMVVQVLTELGADVILEIGPGRAISSIISRYNLPVKVKSIDDFNNLNQVIDWVSRLSTCL